MAGIRKTGNERPDGRPITPPAPGLANGDRGNVHDLFYVRNMFSKIFGVLAPFHIGVPFENAQWSLLERVSFRPMLSFNGGDEIAYCQALIEPSLPTRPFCQRSKKDRHFAGSVFVETKGALHLKLAMSPKDHIEDKYIPIES